jgi:hypothetical protein
VDAVVPGPPLWIRRGGAEVVETLCGPTCIVDDDGPVLEESRAAVEASIREHREARVDQYTRELAEGREGSGTFDWEAVEAQRGAGTTDAEIAAALADVDAEEYGAVYVGVSADGDVIALDEVTGAPQYVIERPDRQ